MAEEKELELDADSSDSSGGDKKKLIIIIVAAVLVVGIGVGVGLFLMGGDDAALETAETAEAAEASEEVTESAAASKGPAIYIKFKPQFIINYQVVNRQRYLQIHMEALTRNTEVAGALDMHSPMIRSAIINLLSTQDFKFLRTAEGRSSIRESLTAEVNRLVTQETGIENGVDQILFTNFVIQ